MNFFKKNILPPVETVFSFLLFRLDWIICTVLKKYLAACSPLRILCIQGYPSTVGVSLYLDELFSSDGAIAAQLKALGAVPFCKTNVGQLMKAHACSNPIYGLTIHPTDRCGAKF